MAFYEFHFNCFLNSDTPLEVIQTLHYMTSKEKLIEPTYTKISKNKLFQESNWDIFLTNYLPHFPFYNTTIFSQSRVHGNILSINCSFISKDTCIIEYFLKWIMPYVVSEIHELLGYYREYKEHPTFLFYEKP